MQDLVGIHRTHVIHNVYGCFYRYERQPQLNASTHRCAEYKRVTIDELAMASDRHGFRSEPLLLRLPFLIVLCPLLNHRHHFVVCFHGVKCFSFSGTHLGHVCTTAEGVRPLYGSDYSVIV